MKKEGQKISSSMIAWVVIAAGIMYAVSGGFRANYGIIINPLTDATGLSYSQASFAFGIAQLMYGLTQPLWGAISMKRSNTFSLACGVILMAVGVAGSPVSHSTVALTFFIGILFASGAGAVSFGIIMSAITPVIGTKKAAGVSGVVNASCGIGSAILSPTLEGTISSVGIKSTMFGFAVVVMLLMFLVFWFRRLNSRYGAGDAENEGSSAEDHEEVSVGEAFRDAFRSPDYRYLMIGFGTCGFHMTIIQTHLVSQIVSYGISESKAAMIYTVYSVAVMVGAIGCGMLCQKFHLKNVLGSVYGSRAVIVPVFIFLMPKTVISLIIFGILLGLTADSTVTPTSEIISRRFGPKSMGFLFGITFVCHQVGGFISSWLGGVLVEGTGNYNTIWMIDIVLCALAAFVSFRIRVHENE